MNCFVIIESLKNENISIKNWIIVIYYLYTLCKWTQTDLDGRLIRTVINIPECKHILHSSTKSRIKSFSFKYMYTHHWIEFILKVLSNNCGKKRWEGKQKAFCLLAFSRPNVFSGQETSSQKINRHNHVSTRTLNTLQTLVD